MHFVIEKSGCSERLGLVEIRFDLFLDPADHNSSAQIIDGVNTPFCCHFYQFESTAADAEILEEGERILAMAYANWLEGDLHRNKNRQRPFVDREIYSKVAKPFIAGLREMAAKGNPFKGDEPGAVEMLADAALPAVEKTNIHDIVQRIKDSEARMDALLATDFDSMQKGL